MSPQYRSVFPAGNFVGLAASPPALHVRRAAQDVPDWSAAGHGSQGDERGRMILVTGATGMFGSRVAREVAARGLPVRGLVRSESRAAALPAGVTPAVGDMDAADSLPSALAGVDTVFLVSPMDHRIRIREGNVVSAAVGAGVTRIVKLYGAVQHRDDPLDRLHQASIETVRGAGLEWALLSPTSVLESTIFGFADLIHATGTIIACAGEGRVALVAADDVARAAAAVLVDRRENGRSYAITGRRALTFSETLAEISSQLDKEIRYEDMPEEAFRAFLTGEGQMTDEEAEIGVICHFRAWRRGDAAIVTDTYRELTGEEPLTPAAWAAENRDRLQALLP